MLATVFLMKIKITYLHTIQNGLSSDSKIKINDIENFEFTSKRYFQGIIALFL